MKMQEILLNCKLNDSSSDMKCTTHFTVLGSGLFVFFFFFNLQEAGLMNTAIGLYFIFYDHYDQL